jgi:hypothetical protein
MEDLQSHPPSEAATHTPCANATLIAMHVKHHQIHTLPQKQQHIHTVQMQLS